MSVGGPPAAWIEPTTAKITFQGVKYREIVVWGAIADPMYFETPGLRANFRRNEPMIRLQVIEFPLRMASFTVNDPGAKGLIAFWAGCLRSIHTVYKEESRNPPYETYTNKKGAWIYFPINDGESVTSLWRRFYSGQSPNAALLVCASLTAFSPCGLKPTDNIPSF